MYAASGDYHRRGPSSSSSQSQLPPDYQVQDGQATAHDADWDPSPYGATEYLDDHVETHVSGRKMPFNPMDSSRSIANGDQLPEQPRYTSAHETRKQATLRAAVAAAGAAGVGANANAYRSDAISPNQADSPSMYTDPYEFQSTAPPPNVVSTRPPRDFLRTDPYDRPLGGPTDLTRSDTLTPHDSISSYNVRIGATEGPQDTGAFAREGGVDSKTVGSHVPYASAYSHGGDHEDYDDARDYYNTSYGHNGYDVSATDIPLKQHAGQMGYAEDEDDEENQMKRGAAPLFSNQVNHLGAAEEDAKSGLLSRFTGGHGIARTKDARTKDEKFHEQIERRRQGIGRQKWPFVSWVMAVALVAVFIVELVKAKSETGQAVQTRPSVNPMLGPSSEFLISFGARFVPCMRDIAKLPVTTELPCLNQSTSSSSTYTANQLCPLWETCGLSDANSPNQGYRFISAIFVHAGFVHIIFNLIVLLTLCAQIEKLIGSIPYTLIYFAGGVGGNLLGGNFGLIGQPALGASGAIYTCISVELVDLIYNWQYEYRAKTRLFVSIVFSIIGLALGLLPGIDNFSHIGGFCVGILGGLMFAPAIHPTQRHRLITWILRFVALGLLIGYFVGLAVNFYNSADPLSACTWCRYLSCLPVFDSCKGDGLTMTTTTTTTTTGPN